ncbi:DUF4142 domain-containing protein [Streptomyces sp. 5-8]|uniref:DUF4142 domain-containing protein n=1 Tax=Streptomyces musisoli TaxID=2802280 RepID=A0ABS1NUX6_9ACTN|nr:DUF4142 domain-containing protein [Streptomyces musisoli]MBL1103913.1 DUF4142 domain-containing protein [Streptomyces musisoli]
MKHGNRSVLVALAAVSVVGVSAGIASADSAAPPATRSDKSFVEFMGNVNVSEIAAGANAQQNATTECVQQAGRVLHANHTQLETKLEPVAASLGVHLPNGPTKADQAMFAPVADKAHTPAYDTAWLNMMFKGHKAVLAKIDQEIANAQNSQVKAYAEMARPVIQAHLNMVYGGQCHTPPPAR